MSRSRHSSMEYLGSPSECSPNSRIRLPVKSLIGEIEANASARPSVLNQSKLAFCNSMRLGISRTCGIFANVKRSRLGPGSGRCSIVKAPVGMGNVAGMTVDAPLPSAPRCDVAERLDLPLVTRVGLGTDSAGLFVADFGAVVFAITLFLCADNLQLMNASGAAAFR